MHCKATYSMVTAHDHTTTTPHTAIPQFEPSNMVSAALCVTTVVVCVVTQDDQAVACYPWGVGAYRPSALWRP